MKHYSHCPVCGAAYREEASAELSDAPRSVSVGAAPSLLLCRACGFHFWQNSKPAVGALLIRSVSGRPRILLSRRGVEPYRGMWDFPGGFLSNGESPEHGLARELEEELGVRVEYPRLFSLGIDEYPADDVAEEARFVLSIFFRCEIASDAKLSASDDVAEVRWFPLDAPPELAFPSNVTTLRELARVLGEESAKGRSPG